EGRRVGGEDELLVDAADGVGVDDVEGTGGGGEGVTEAGDVDAGEFELGGEVVAVEGRVAAEDPVADHLGHGVSGGDQAHALPVEGGDLADRVDAGVGGGAGRVDPHPAAFLAGKARRTGELVAGAHADGEDDEVGGHLVAVPEEDGLDRSVGTGAGRGGPGRGRHGAAGGRGGR